MFYIKKNVFLWSINMLINQAFAADVAASASSSGGMTSMIIQIVLIFAIFYLLLIRPQQKRIKEHEAKVNALKKGDKVITGGGIIAKVMDVNAAEDEITVEVASGVTIKLVRSTIREVLTDEIVAAANNNKKAKNKK